MACPHFSREDNDCLLLQDRPADEAELGEVVVEEPPNPSWCAGEGDGYRNCPIYRRFLAELLR